VEISFQLTTDDYRQAYNGFRKRTAFSRWAYRIYYVLFVLILASALLLSFFGPNKSFAYLFPLWAIAAFWAYVLWYCPYYVARKMTKGSRVTTLPETAEITDAGIYSRTSAAESRLAWESIIGWVEVDRVFALFLTPISFFPIPKRAMSEAQQAEFRALLKSKVLR
jgi:YcxB-like protein